MNTPATLEKPDTPPQDTPPQDTPAETVDAGQLVAPLGERMPPVTDGATAPEEKPPSEAGPASPSPQVWRDARGTLFDPANHATNEDGTPKTNKFGNFYSKAVGQKGKIPGARPTATPRPPPSFAISSGGPMPAPGANDDEMTADSFDGMAEVYLQSSYGPAMLLFSEEVKPDKDEHAALRQALAAVLRKRQATELSPEWTFGLLAIAIIVKKTEKPRVRERLALWWLKVKGLFGRKPVTAPAKVN